MTSSAVDILYGRRGWRWPCHRPGQLLAEIHAISARQQSDGTWHPETIAARAHQRECGGRHHPHGDSCPTQPTASDLADAWAGRARMAGVRRSAGQSLSDLDRHAFDRMTEPGAAR